MAPDSKRRKPCSTQQAPYEIMIAGELDGRWAEWFNGIEVIPGSGGSDRIHTLLRCPALDQARLRGILNKLWNMNLSIISVRQVQPVAGDGRH